MRYLILTVGSAGDVFPMVSLGAGLRARGHEVTLVATSGFRSLAERNGLYFLGLSESDSAAASIRQKPLMMTRYAGLYHEKYSVQWNCTAYSAIRGLAGKDLMVIAVDRPNLWADLYARAQFGTPVLRVQLDLPYLGRPTGHIDFLPCSRVQRTLATRCETRWREAMTARGIETGHLRIERLGRAVGRTVSMIALWPLWMLGEGVVNYACPTFGFMPAPESPADREQPHLGQAGRPTVVFVAGTHGTTSAWARSFFETSAQVCARLQCLGVFLGGEDSTESAWDSEWIVRRKFYPLREALRGASAIVHHGGIGTAAAAMEHGVPQLLIPRIFGQPGNAEWLRRLGVGVVRDFKSYTPAGAEAGLREVLANSRYREASQRYSRLFNPDADLRKVCEYVEDPALLTRLNSGAPREVAAREWTRRANGHTRSTFQFAGQAR